MPQLHDTQRWLASVILEPDKLDDAAFAGEIAGTLVCTSPEAVAARLRAYTGGYPARLAEALEEVYPTLKHVIGASAFYELVLRYLPHAPVGVYNLNDVGAPLPAFVAQDALARDFPFAPDLAHLEQVVQVAFHAREKSALDPASLADWTLDDWSSAVLEFQPSVALIASAWPIRDIWDARETPIEQIDIELEGRPQHVLIHRSGYKVVCEVIEADEAAALELVRAGATLAHTIEQIAERNDDPESVTQWFAKWMSRGLIAAVR